MLCLKCAVVIKYHGCHTKEGVSLQADAADGESYHMVLKVLKAL